MGYNSTVVVMNDALHQIENDPDFGKKLAQAVRSLSVRNDYADVSAGNHCNAATVVATHHADIHSVVIVGGNNGKVIGSSLYSDTEKIFREVADQLGYRLLKKRKT